MSTSGGAVRSLLATSALAVLTLTACGSEAIHSIGRFPSYAKPLPPRPATYSVRVVNVSPQGSDTRGNGSSSRPYRTFARALSAVGPLVRRRWVVQAAPGVYEQSFDLSRLVGPVGLDAYEIHRGVAPEAFVELRGKAGDPGAVVLDGGGRRSCVVAHDLTLVVEGITCRDPGTTGFDLSGGSTLADDVTITGAIKAGIAVENGQLYIGGQIEVATRPATSEGAGGFGLSIRSGSSVREGTLRYGNVELRTHGGRAGIYLRDQSSFSIFGLMGGSNSVDVERSYFGIDVQEGCSLFFGIGVNLRVAHTEDAVVALGLSNVDVAGIHLVDSREAFLATKGSNIAFDRTLAVRGVDSWGTADSGAHVIGMR